MADEDVSMEIFLPLPMNEIYRVREHIYNWVLDLQERHEVLILATALPH